MDLCFSKLPQDTEYRLAQLKSVNEMLLERSKEMDEKQEKWIKRTKQMEDKLMKVMNNNLLAIKLLCK